MMLTFRYRVLTWRAKLTESKDKKFYELVGGEKLGRQVNEVYDLYDKYKIEDAYKLINQIFKDNPNNLYILSLYAGILGDYGQVFPGPEEDKYKKEAVSILKAALKKLNGKSSNIKKRIRNEYYYHSRQFYKQYRLGVEITGGDSNIVDFSKAVGASEYSWELLCKKQYKRAKAYADISVYNWIGLGKELKLNVFYYQALAISGKSEEAYITMKNDVSSFKYYEYEKIWFDKYLARIEHVKCGDK